VARLAVFGPAAVHVDNRGRVATFGDLRITLGAAEAAQVKITRLIVDVCRARADASRALGAHLANEVCFESRKYFFRVNPNQNIL
jgi:hypothetical protein